MHSSLVAPGYSILSWSTISVVLLVNLAHAKLGVSSWVTPLSIARWRRFDSPTQNKISNC